MGFNSQQILSYLLGLRTQNSGLREEDLEPSPKAGSDKINMLRDYSETFNIKNNVMVASCFNWPWQSKILVG